jgi:hypothetical protein
MLILAATWPEESSTGDRSCSELHFFIIDCIAASLDPAEFGH